MTLLVLAGCSSSGVGGPTLTVQGADALGLQAPTTKLNVPYVYFLRSVCTSGGPIQIIGVGPASRTGGLRVSSWGIRREGFGATDAAVLNSVLTMPGWSHAPVTVKCTDKAYADAFAVSLVLNSSRATMSGVTISYRSGGRIRHVFSQYSASLCTGKVCPPPRPEEARLVTPHPVTEPASP